MRDRAWIFRATGNEPWRPVLEVDAMPYALIPFQDRLLAGLSNGRVLVSETRGESWSELPFRFASIWPALLATRRGLASSRSTSATRGGRREPAEP